MFSSLRNLRAFRIPFAARNKHQDLGMNKPELYQTAQEVQLNDNTKVLDFFKDALNKNLGDGKQALDIGCGSADFTLRNLQPLMIEKFGCKRVVATDVSTSMIEFAKKTYPHPSTRYDIFDVSSRKSAENVVSRYGQFEFVFSFYTLHWVRDLDKALANVRHVMRTESDSSECLLSFLALNPALLVYQKLENNPRWGNYIAARGIPFGGIYDPETLRAKAESSGIKLSTCEVLEKETRYGNAQQLKNAVIAVCPIHKTIPTELTADYENDLVKAYMEVNGGSDVIAYKLAVLHGSAV